MLRLPLVALLLVASFTVAACGGSKDKAPAATPAAVQEGKTVAGCEKVADPGPKDVGKPAKPKTQLQAGRTYVVKVATNCGDFEITLDPKDAPKTGGSFAALAKQGFFDGLTFHRIVPGFVIQGGDPKGDGTGGPGYSVVEAPPKGLQYTRGVVAMAKTELEKPGTSGSQFFIVTGEDAGLPADYALVGRVTAGEDVVDKIGVLGDQSSQQPTEVVVMKSVTVSER
jgi:cyclophilin family peptidyl-prolyl cis-trans isomerase